jgi:hypothetical protein
MESIMIMPTHRTDQEVSVKERFRNLKIGNRHQLFVAATKGVKAGVFYELAEITGTSEQEIIRTSIWRAPAQAGCAVYER